MLDRATHGPRSRGRSPSRGTADMKSRVALHEIRCRSPPAAIRFSPALRNVPMNCRHALLRFRHALDPVPQPGAPRTVNPTAVFGADCEGYDDRLEAADSMSDDGLVGWCSFVLHGIREDLDRMSRLTDGRWVTNTGTPSARSDAIRSLLDRRLLVPIAPVRSHRPHAVRHRLARPSRPPCRGCSPSHDGDGRGGRRLRGAGPRARAAG